MDFHKNSIVCTRMSSLGNSANEPISKLKLDEIAKKNTLIFSMVSRNNALPGRIRVFSRKKFFFSIQISRLSMLYFLQCSMGLYTLLSYNIYYSNKTNKSWHNNQKCSFIDHRRDIVHSEKTNFVQDCCYSPDDWYYSDIEPKQRNIS